MPARELPGDEVFMQETFKVAQQDDQIMLRKAVTRCNTFMPVSFVSLPLHTGLTTDM